MRTIKYRDVLWAAAYRIGLDPAKEFLQDQADAAADYVNGWIRRLYDSQDWPEWTQTRRFTVPANHIVPYTVQLGAILGVETIGRVFEVYLLDPSTTPSPVDTPFELMPEGIHAGYEHGSFVWIKYIAACPQFTSTPWRSDIRYGLGDLVYLPARGDCYRSRTANNIGHDPSIIFSHQGENNPPPGSDGTPSPIPLTTEIIQERTADDPGLLEKNQIYVIDFDHFKPSGSSTTAFHIPNPPEANSSFYIDIFDGNGALLGEGGPIVANGVDTVEAIMTALAADLQTSLGGTFIVTSVQKTVTIENNSVFYTGHSFYVPAIGYPHYFPIPMVQQSYIPPVTGAAGQPQKTVITMTEDQVDTGSTFRLTLIGSDGMQHTVEYTSQEGDSAPQVLAGLTTAIEAARADDDYFNSVGPTLDPSTLTLTLDIQDVASVDSSISRAGSVWWELEQVPFELGDPIIRGVVADIFREEGQTDRADGEEKKVESEVAMASSKFTSPQFAPLTTQQKPRSRYAIK